MSCFVYNPICSLVIRYVYKIRSYKRQLLLQAPEPDFMPEGEEELVLLEPEVEPVEEVVVAPPSPPSASPEKGKASPRTYADECKMLLRYDQKDADSIFTTGVSSPVPPPPDNTALITTRDGVAAKLLPNTFLDEFIDKHGKYELTELWREALAREAAEAAMRKAQEELERPDELLQEEMARLNKKVKFRQPIPPDEVCTVLFSFCAVASDFQCMN